MKNKNIRLLRGKPLIAHSILQAKQAGLFTSIAISSDSAKIRQVSQQWGADYVIERPAEMATATAAKLPAIQHAVQEAERASGTQFDYIVDLDATSPLRAVEDIVNAFQQFANHPDATNLVTACPARRSPYFNMLEMQSTGYATLAKTTANAIVRRQDVPACYDMNASIYIWKRDTLFSSEKVITANTLLYVMPEERSIDIDSPLDWKFVSLLAPATKGFIR